MPARRTDSRQPARAFRAAATLAVEPLEQRVFLAGESDSALLAEGFVRTNWRRQSLYVKPGEWVIRLDGITGGATAQERTLAARLARAGIPAIVRQNLGSDGLFLVQPRVKKPYRTLLAAWRTAPGFRYLEPNFAVSVAATFPNDPQFAQQWGLNNTGQSGGTPDADIDAPEAWDITRGDNTLVVAVIDTGVDWTHPDLAANIWTNPGEVPGDGIDNDGNGFIDDVRGWDFANDDNNPMDDHGHGTHVAGIISAVGNNAVGVAGVNWHTKILPVKFMRANGYGELSGAIAAVNYCTALRQRGVNLRISNNSWGGDGFSLAMRDAINAHGAAGIIFVAAAGNDNSNNDTTPFYPATYDSPNLISVLSTNNLDQRSGFSNYGAQTVHIGAPGENIYSTLRNGGYGNMSGTSMASPMVAGAAALAFAASPRDTPWQTVRDAILNGGDPLPSLAGRTTTGRRLNAFGALMQLPLTVLNTSPLPGQVLTSPPSAFLIELSHPCDAASVDASDLLVNGIPADTVEQVDARTLRFQFAASPVTTQGEQTMSLASGSIVRSGDSAGLSPFSAVFRYDAAIMEVSSIDPAGGTVVPPPLVHIDVHLSEPVDPASVSPGDLLISRGSVLGAQMLDSSSIRFSLAGLDSECWLDVTIPAGAFADQWGNPSAQFAASINIDLDNVPWPGPVLPLAPAGSLAYAANAEGLVSFGGDEDAYTINPDSGQRMSLLLEPAALLRGRLTVRDGTGATVAQAAASWPGQTVVAADIPTAGGPFTITVSAADAGTGSYRLALVLGATLERELYEPADNNTRPNAQNLEPVFEHLASGGRTAAVRGRSDLPSGILPVEIEPNDSLASANSARLNFVPSSAPLYQMCIQGEISVANDYDWFALGTLDAGDVLSVTSSGSATPRGTLSDPLIQLYRGAPDNPVLVIENDDDGPGTDALLYRLTVPATDSYYILARAWTTQTGTYDLALWLEDTADPPLTGGNFSAEVESNNTSLTANDASSSWRPVSWSSATDGQIASSDHDVLAYQFCAGDIVTVAVEARYPLDASIALKNSAGTTIASEDGTSIGPHLNSLIYAMPIRSSGTYYLDVSARSGTGPYTATVYLSTATAPPQPAPVPDYYRVTLDAGERITAAVASASGAMDVCLEDAAGNLLAFGMPAANADSAVADFVAPAPSDYYLRVCGPRNTDYVLSVARNAVFDLEPNNSPATAQDISATGSAMGWLDETDEDWLQFTAGANHTIQIQTFTPGDAPGEFVNVLDPTIRLYDPAGELIAADDNSAGDGRNAVITWRTTQSGVYRVRLAAADASGPWQLRLTDFTVGLSGSPGDDVFRIALDETASSVLIERSSPPALWAVPVELLHKLTILGGDGNDRLTIDALYGSPVPPEGLVFSAQQHSAGGGDVIQIIGDDSTAAELLPDSAVAGSGILRIGGRSVFFSGVERIDGQSLASMTIVTPNANDTVTLSTPAPQWGAVMATSASISLPQVRIFNVSRLILDAAANDGASGDDSFAVSSEGFQPAGLQSLQLLAGNGNNTLSVNGGHLTIDTSGAGGSRLAVSVSGSSVLYLPAGQTLASLALAGSAVVRQTAGSGEALSVGVLSIADDAVLDLGAHDLVIRAEPLSRSAVLQNVSALIASGRNGGAWNGTGIITSSGGGVMGLAAVINDDGSGQALYNVFSGHYVDANCVLVKYTMNGDADVDGRISAADYFRIDQGMLNGLTGYRNGDFNYDGTIDADDLFLIDQSYLG